MPNPYHDENGRFCSKGEMNAAIDRVLDTAARATTDKKRDAATELLLKLKREYNEAESGGAVSDMKATSVPATPKTRKPAVKPTTAKPKAARTTVAAAKTIPIPENTLTLPAKHTYKVAGGSVDPDAYGRGYTGAKYTGYQSVTVIAKGIREDLKEAQEKGYLPKHLTYSVRTSKYSGGQSLDVTIQGAKDKDLYTPDDDFGGGHRYTAEAKELTSRVQNIVDAYKYDNSNHYAEIYNTNFYDHVKIEDESSAQFREKMAKIDKNRTQGYAYRKDLKAAVGQAASPTAYFEQEYKFAQSTKDGSAQFDILKAPTPMIVVRRPARQGFGEGPRYDLYDLSSFEIKEDLHKTLSNYDISTLRNRFSRYSFDLVDKPARRR